MKEMMLIIFTVMVIFSCNSPALAETDGQPVTPTMTAVTAADASLPAADQPVPATAKEGPSAGMQILDVAIVRPLCVIGSTASTAVYIAISPLVFVMGLGEPAARVMVEAPWRFTAFRYVGEFSHYRDELPIMGVWDF